MTSAWPKPPPTRILSWLQMVTENDPYYGYELRNPIVYEFSNGRYFRTSPGGYTFGAGLSDNGGVLTVSNTTNWPTSPTGLPPGSVWDNGGVVCIVSGGTGGALYYGAIDAPTLLAIGLGGAPTTAPTPGSLRIWNNGGVACVA